jgi:flagellin-like hook-associated protein FlgL
MASTILSSGVRNNLLTLQQTTAQQSVIQNRLATGKRVSSAIDNPVNFFTSLALNDRSSQLTGLLDGISNGIQTIQAASKGIDGVTKLVQSLQSTVKQAQADAAQNRPTKAGTALATATEAAVTSKSLKDIALDKSILDLTGGTVTTADAATATSAGDLGIAVANTSLALSITVGTTTYEASFNGANATVRDVVNEINKSGIATAFVDEKGQLNVKGAGSQTVDFGFGAAATAGAAITAAQGGGNNTAIGFLAADAVVGTSTIVAQNITSAVRSNLIQQFNDLRTQIDQLAKDSSFNGVNLLQGDRLSIIFNEKTGTNQTKLEIQGTTLSANNLGIEQAINTQLAGFVNFQNDRCARWPRPSAPTSRSRRPGRTSPRNWSTPSSPAPTTSSSPIPTRKAPACSRSTRASSSRRRRCRSPTRPTRACCGSSADRADAAAPSSISRKAGSTWPSRSSSNPRNASSSARW